MGPQSLSIFFPMYNERQNIEHVLEEVERVIPQFGTPNYEVLIIDDGSHDGCDLLVEKYIRHNNHIRLIRHERNLGYGSALRTGFTQAANDVILYTDCDLPVDLRDFGKAIPLLINADVVIGYRTERHETLRRAIYSRIYNLLMQWLFGVQVQDVNFSFKLVRRSVLQNIHLTASTVFIDGQLLAEATRYGFRLTEIPIAYTPRKFGSSNFDSFYSAWSTLVEMIGYWYLRSRENKRVASYRI
jgi:glycosyltransferase involved in cell wall biosynthesis